MKIVRILFHCVCVVISFFIYELVCLLFLFFISLVIALISNFWFVLCLSGGIFEQAGVDDSRVSQHIFHTGARGGLSPIISIIRYLFV